jgi:hypothetical protein
MQVGKRSSYVAVWCLHAEEILLLTSIEIAFRVEFKVHLDLTPSASSISEYETMAHSLGLL